MGAPDLAVAAALGRVVSAINQMLRDLDKRSARAHADTVPGERPAAAAAPDVAPNKLAGAYAGVRMMSPRTRWSRNLLLAGGVAALLPIAWATTTYLDRPVSAHLPTWAATAAPNAVVPTPAAPAPVVMAAVQVAAVHGAAAEPAPVLVSAPVQMLAPTPMPPPPAAELAPTVLAQAAPIVVSAPPPKSRLVRAPVMPLGEDESPAPTPAPAARPATRPAMPKDTRLALAAPAVPKDEARIERHPTDARDDLVRAGEAMSIGRTSDAIALLRKVIQAEPANERARLALLSLLAERGRDDTWRSTLTESAKVLPKRFGLAAAQGLAESGRFEESLALLQGLPESVRDTRYFSALGATHQQLNQHAEAVAAFDAALGTAAGSSPQLPSLLVAQALSMQTLGKAAEARRNLERVRQMPEAAADVREFATRELAHSR